MWLLVIWLGVLLSIGRAGFAAPPSVVAGPVFSSTYTDLDKGCASDPDSEEGRICKPVGEYVLRAGYSACATALTVEGKSKYVFHLPDVSAWGVDPGRRLEWRLANGKPFAVIYRVRKYEALDHPCGRGREIGSTLYIRGLRGFEAINTKVPGNRRDANLEARKISDQGFSGSARIRQ